MLRQRLASTLLVGLTGLLGLYGCPSEVELEPPVDPADFVIAQFDVTHPIPVLQIFPSPTFLAENLDGTLNKDRLVAHPCERPSPKECLQLVDYWPTTTPISLFFSGELDITTIPRGIKLFEILGQTLKPLAFTTVSRNRVAPNESCQSGGNGSAPERTFNAGDLPPGIELILQPTEPIKADAQYVLLVEGHETEGLKGRNNRAVQPSSLFAVLNVGTEFEPVAADGTIASALLRGNVQNSVLSTAFGGRPFAELTASERPAFQKAVQEAGLELRALYVALNGLTELFLAAGVLKDRSRAVLVNTWHTGPRAPTEIEFNPDPNNPKVPFPNNELFTVTSSATNQKSLFIPSSTTDSNIAADLKTALGTLDGFSTTATITITSTRDIDQASLEGNILMYPVDADGTVQGAAVDLELTALPGTSVASSAIAIRPRQPLDQNRNYLIAVKNGIRDTDQNTVVAAPLFEITKLKAPFVQTDDTVLPVLEGALRCANVQTTGTVLSDPEIKLTAQALEGQVRQPFERVLEHWEGQDASIKLMRSEILMAWTYKTQTITAALDAVRAQLLPAWAQTLVPNGTSILGPTAPHPLGEEESARTLLGVCMPLCERGAFVPTIPAGQCQTRPGDVGNHPLCIAATSNIGSINAYTLKGFGLTQGSPMSANGGAFNPQIFRNPSATPPALVDIPFWVAMPNNFEGDVPIAIFQHGLGAFKETGFLLANSLAAAGWATVMMDAPFHGARASDLVNNSTMIPCTGKNPKEIVCNATPACVGSTSAPCSCEQTTGCDGLQDPSGTGFLSANLFATRDNFRQTTVDQLTLIRALQTETGPGTPLQDLDGSRISYVGQSLGAITGGTLAAYVGPSEVGQFVLNAPAGGLLSVVLATIPSINTSLFLALGLSGICELVDITNPALGCKDSDEFRQLLALAQAIIDPGDPLANSIQVDARRPHHSQTTHTSPQQILMQMAASDLVLVNATARDLASAYAIGDPGTPLVGQLQTFNLTPIASTDSGCHPWFLAPVCGGTPLSSNPALDTVCQTLGAQAQAVAFLASSGNVVADQVPVLNLGALGMCPAP